MAEGKQKEQWNHTSQLLALLYNAFRDRRSPALQPSDFHPFVKKRAMTVTLKQLSDLGILKPSGE